MEPFDHYYRELLNFLSRKVSDRATAADLTQESYARVYAAQRAGAAIRDPRALLYQTARHLVIDHHRHGEVRAGTELPAADTEAAEAPGPRDWEPETALASDQGVAALVCAIDQLPPRCRQAFMFSRFDGMSYGEIAARMGISVKGVEQHLKNALDACERCRAASGGESDAAAGPRRKLHRSRHD